MTDRIWKREEQAVFALRSLYSRYGYVPYKMSHFEEYELYVHNKDFLVSDQIITFSGEGGRLLALKPDVTLSIVKNAPQTPGVVQKVYYDENVYRDYREIRQAGLECVGDLGEYEISEVVMLAVRSLSLMQERFALNISHMGLINVDDIFLYIVNSRDHIKGRAQMFFHLRRHIFYFKHCIGSFREGLRYSLLQMI